MASSWAVLQRPAAQDDLRDPWFRIAIHDESAADRLLRRIGQATAQLIHFPRSGSMREWLAEDCRALSVAGHLVVYRVDDRRHIVEIIRVVDARRDLSSTALDL